KLLADRITEHILNIVETEFPATAVGTAD
ncbi:MAG: hypothetical protein QOF44_1576, partial [Streptomyces sp.]|nr:hypothetical protein [Streptomyces sp.]